MVKSAVAVASSSQSTSAILCRNQSSCSVKSSGRGDKAITMQYVISRCRSKDSLNASGAAGAAGTNQEAGANNTTMPFGESTREDLKDQRKKMFE